MNWLDYLLIAILGSGRGVSTAALRGRSSPDRGHCCPGAGNVVLRKRRCAVRTWVSSDRAANLIGFLLVVFAVLATGAIIGSIVRSFLKAVGLSFFDRLLGACFGLLRGLLISIALLTAYIAFGPQSGSGTAPAAVVHSQIAPFILKVSSILVDAAPAELRRDFREVYDEARVEIENIARPDNKGATHKELGDEMKESFDSLIDHLVSGGFFLEEAVEILEKGMIARALAKTNQNPIRQASCWGFTAIRCRGR